MDFLNELEFMRLRYKKRILPIKVPNPHAWLTPDHPLSVIFKEKDALLKHGQVFYAHIVQANSILFQPTPRLDCPASILYSVDPIVTANPQILYELSHMFYSFKDQPLEEVPEQWREIARIITDEHDYTPCTFSIMLNDHEADIHFLPIMIFRSHLPDNILSGNLLPVLVAPDHCSTVMVLPQQFWSAEFKQAWTSHQI